VISHVRPGEYTLHAFADGVLGEFAKGNITVVAGRPLDLGSLGWIPVRYGKQLWEIGTPDRTAGEFRHGDHYWTWGIYNQYPKDFPNDVVYTVGKSDARQDWNLMQVPRGHDDTGRGKGTATTWTVKFRLPKEEHGRATLRIAFAGTEIKSLQVAVNGTAVGTLADFINTSVIHRDADRGYWCEREVPFDAALLHGGENTLTLAIPAGGVMNGVEYDYLRLELDEHASAPVASAAK
jgi:rhamnogalacturonan endolyase